MSTISGLGAKPISTRFAPHVVALPRAEVIRFAELVAQLLEDLPVLLGARLIDLCDEVALQVGCDAIIVEQCVVGDRRCSWPTCIARSNSANPYEFLSEHQLYAAYPHLSAAYSFPALGRSHEA